MGNGLFELSAVATAALASAGLGWLLQRAMPKLHPLLTAVSALIILVVLDAVVAALVVFRALVTLGEMGRPGIDGPGSLAVWAYTFGVLEAILLVVVGYPVAVIAAFVRRRHRQG